MPLLNAKLKARECWIEKESSNLLDCPYFHIVTTIPSELNEIALYNKKEFYNILFSSTSEAILELCEDPKWLGAKVGITYTTYLGLHDGISSTYPFDCHWWRNQE